MKSIIFSVVLYHCILLHEHKLKVSENRVLKIFWLKRRKVNGIEGYCTMMNLMICSIWYW